MSSVLLIAILVGGLAAQALVPGRRLVIVLTAAALASLVTGMAGIATASQLLAGVPWDVLVFLIGLGLFTDLLAQTRVFDVLAVWAARAGGGHGRRVLLVFAGVMYAVSCFANNLTALVLVLPVLLQLLRLIGVDRRYVGWTLGTIVAACNLGGAATPIGDFPAILLLAAGRMEFSRYLSLALPPTALALVLLLLVVGWVARPHRSLGADPLTRRLGVRVVEQLYRGVRVEKGHLWALLAILVSMMLAWTFVPRESGITPELVVWLGAVVGALSWPAKGEQALRRRVDVEASLFLLSLFVLVGAIRATGAFADLAGLLARTPGPPEVQLGVFLVGASLVTATFSAGPGMAALLEVADKLAVHMPPSAVYVGLALAVCSGSCLFLTAATAGPLAQSLTERADLRGPDGEPVHYDFLAHLSAGLTAYAVVLGTGLLWSLGVLFRLEG